MIVIVKANNDKIELTPEEFKKYLEEARKEGYDEGYKVGYAEGKQVYPYIIQPNWEPKKNWWDNGITWTASTLNTSGTHDPEKDNRPIVGPNNTCMLH